MRLVPRLRKYAEVKWMPLPPNPVCLACIDYSRAEAKHLRGPQGDGCWKDNTCDRKRNRYRHRKGNNAKWRGEYAEQKAKIADIEATAATIHIPVYVPPVALVYLYMEKPNSHLRALTVSVWQGSTKLAEVAAIEIRRAETWWRQIIDGLQVLMDIESRLAALF